jgi:hypothetical protein
MGHRLEEKKRSHDMLRYQIPKIVKGTIEDIMLHPEVLKITSVCTGNGSGEPCSYFRALVLRYSPPLEPKCTLVRVICTAATKSGREQEVCPPFPTTIKALGDCPRRMVEEAKKAIND